MPLLFVFLIVVGFVFFFPLDIRCLRELERKKVLPSAAFLPHTCSLRSTLGTFAEPVSLLNAEKIS